MLCLSNMAQLQLETTCPQAGQERATGAVSETGSSRLNQFKPSVNFSQFFSKYLLLIFFSPSYKPLTSITQGEAGLTFF